MKVAIKIIVYGIWLGFILWLSIYGSGVFSELVNLIEKRIIRTDIPPEIDFAITIIPWNCFISLLVCFPIWLMKKRWSDAASEIGRLIEFFFILLGCNLFSVLIWSVYFPESIGNYNGAPSLSTIEPYAINDGWSPFEFWGAWWAYMVMSNAISVTCAFLIWQPSNQKPTIP